jgi:lysophospholipase L1-like esterase
MGILDAPVTPASLLATGKLRAGTFGKVLVLGTSIANATGASTTAKGYASLLPSKISPLLQSLPITSVPAGVNGNTSGQMYVRLRALMETHRPAYVFIETSINDTRDDLAITPDQTVENIRASVSMVRMFGATPIVGTSAPISWQTFGAPYSAQSLVEQGQANTLVKAAMAELGVQVVDLFAIYGGAPQNLTDGIHPNDTGHDQWATNIARAIAGRTPISYAPPYSADTFTRSNSADLGSSEVGAFAWTTANPTFWNITSNKLIVANTAGATAPNDCLVNDGQSNGVLSLTRVTNSSSSGLAFRVSADNATGYLLYRSGSNYVLAKRTTATAYTTLVTSSGVTPAVNDVLSVTLNGSSIKASINGVQFADVTDASYAGTRHGAWTNLATASEFDNWEHKPLP